MSKNNLKISKAVEALQEREGSLMTGDNHIEMEGILQGLKEQHITALNNDDSTGKMEVYNTMNKISGSVAKWQAIGAQVPDINNKVGWSKAMPEKHAKAIANITSGSGKLALDKETGEILLEYGSKKYNAAEFDNMISGNVKPTQEVSRILERNTTMFEAGNQGDNNFTYGSIYQENKNTVSDPNSPNVASYLFDEIIPGKPTIAEQIKNHPDLSEHTPEIREAVVQSLTDPEQSETAIELIAQALTDYDRIGFERGSANFKKNNEILASKADETTQDSETPSKGSWRKRMSSLFNGFTTNWAPAIDALKKIK